VARFKKAGVNIDELASRLQREGAESFVASWKELLKRIADKSESLEGAPKEFARSAR
jgi:transaldolase